LAVVAGCDEGDVVGASAGGVERCHADRGGSAQPRLDVILEGERSRGLARAVQALDDLAGELLPAGEPLADRGELLPRRAALIKINVSIKKRAGGHRRR